MTPPAVPAICGERSELPVALVGAARRLAPFATTLAEDVERDLRCTLERHTLGDHHAFVMELPGSASGAVWTCWSRGHPPPTVFVLPDCATVSPPPAREPCCEFAAHPGAHTWQLKDAWHTTRGT